MNRKSELKRMGLGKIGGIRERKSLGQRVFENLKQAVITGSIVPGSRLIESRLAEALGISRTPVREAIHMLEREGYLKKLPRGGFTVLGFSRRDIEETFGIRSILESYAARLAAAKHQEAALKPLEDKIKTYQQCLDANDLDSLLKINTEFHELLYALSQSPRLVKMINDLKDQIYRYRKLILKNERLARVSNEDHKRMLEYIRRRDEEGVEKLVRDHLIRGQRAVLDQIDIFRDETEKAEAEGQYG
jgi:DNA-binding GntR family transcriptional regulator